VEVDGLFHLDGHKHLRDVVSNKLGSEISNDPVEETALQPSAAQR
jgi:hypothetical protein